MLFNEKLQNVNKERHTLIDKISRFVELSIDLD